MLDAEARAQGSLSTNPFGPPTIPLDRPGRPSVRTVLSGPESTARSYIRHARGHPIYYDQPPRYATQRPSHAEGDQCGIYFEASRPFHSGSSIHVTIPVRQQEFHFLARICWTQPRRSGYEVGVVFSGKSECFRARMVEQLCYIEAYRESMHSSEGRELDMEAAAMEWITRYAGLFPTI